MAERAQAIFQELSGKLNPKIFSLDSIEGVIVLALAIFVIYHIGRKAIKFVLWGVGFIVLVQILYVLGRSGLNQYIPISVIFKYDIITALAQLCVGTRLSEWLLYAASWIASTFGFAGDFIAGFITKIKAAST